MVGKGVCKCCIVLPSLWETERNKFAFFLLFIIIGHFKVIVPQNVLMEKLLTESHEELSQYSDGVVGYLGFYLRRPH